MRNNQSISATTCIAHQTPHIIRLFQTLRLIDRLIFCFAMANTLKLAELNLNGVDFDTFLQQEHDETLKNPTHHAPLRGLPLQHPHTPAGLPLQQPDPALGGLPLQHRELSRMEELPSPAPTLNSAVLVNDETTEEQLAVLGRHRSDWEAGADDDRPKTPDVFSDQGSEKVNPESLAEDDDLEDEGGRRSPAASRILQACAMRACVEYGATKSRPRIQSSRGID